MLAAALVAGVVANFLASGELPQDWPPARVVEFMTDRASWERRSNTNGVWNLVDSFHNPPASSVGNGSRLGLGLESFNDSLTA